MLIVSGGFVYLLVFDKFEIKTALNSFGCRIEMDQCPCFGGQQLMDLSFSLTIKASYRMDVESLLHPSQQVGYMD